MSYKNPTLVLNVIKRAQTKISNQVRQINSKHSCPVVCVNYFHSGMKSLYRLPLYVHTHSLSTISAA